jgi:hypothetical protein
VDDVIELEPIANRPECVISFLKRVNELSFVLSQRLLDFIAVALGFFSQRDRMRGVVDRAAERNNRKSRFSPDQNGSMFSWPSMGEFHSLSNDETKPSNRSLLGIVGIDGFTRL